MTGERHSLFSLFQRLLVVSLLSVGMVLLHQYAVPESAFDPRAMLALGFVILAAYTIGEMATGIGIPHITGYLVAGILFGPSLPVALRALFPNLHLPPPLDGGIVSRGVLGQLGPVDALALALIALSAGGELELDELRRTVRYVVGSTLGMVFTTIASVFALLATTMLLMPAVLPVFAAQPLKGGLVLCLLVATLAAATSPAVSIAVIHSTNARGPVASAVLTGVVVGEIVLVVLFAGISSVALPILGGVGSTTVAQSVLQVVASVGIGLVAGAAIATYLRYVAVDLLLFLVGTIFGTTWLVTSVHGEPAVAFIAGGLVVGNASRVGTMAGPDVGRMLLTNVERMSRPVFAVFFALAGAKLQLETLAALALPAVAIFVVRGLAVRTGTTFGARLSSAPPMVEKYAWTGFISQAGLAIALATQARNVLPEGVRDSVYSLALAVVAIAELVGPSVLQQGLRAAQEIPEGGGASARPAPERVVAVEPAAVRPWGAPTPAHWPTVPVLGDEESDTALREVDEGLRRIVDTEITAPFDALRRDAETWLRLLRQQWARHVRPARWTHLRDRELAAELRRAMSAGLASSVELVRSFDPVADTDRSPFVAGPVVEAVDRLVGGLPGARTVPIPPAFLAPRPERMRDQLRRAVLRLGVRTIGARRSMSLRDLGRYHLSGGVVAALEPVLALGPNARTHLADRVSGLYEVMTTALGHWANQAESGVDAEVVHLGLATDLQVVEQRYQEIALELLHIALDGTERGRAALGSIAQAMYVDAGRAGTFELSSGGPRYRPRFRERNRKTHQLSSGVALARTMTRSRYDELLVQLELLAWRVRVEEVARREARDLDDRFARRILEGFAQIDRDADRWLDLASDALDGATTHEVLAAEIEARWLTVRSNLTGEIAGVRALAVDLQRQSWSNPVVEALNEGLDGLSASHLLGVRRASGDRNQLPRQVQVSTVATARRAAGLVESRVVQPLRELGEELARDAQETLAVAAEVERVTQFNVELALAELELLPPEENVYEDRRDQLRAMLVTAPTRTRGRVGQRREGLSARGGTYGAVVACVETGLGRFDQDLRSNDVEVAPPSGWWLGLPERVAHWRASFVQSVGPDRLRAAQRALGIAPPLHPSQLAWALRLPSAPTAIPQAYERLFSDLPFETGDLVAGRQAELTAVREALSSGLRSAVVYGVDPHGARALVSAVLATGRPPLRFDADGPAGPDTLARWLDPFADGSGQVFVIESLRWLFHRGPGGLAQIEELGARILADAGRNQWILLADGGVWQFLSAATSIRGAVGAAVELAALTEDELLRALLSRHSMSGYEAWFRPQQDVVFRLRRATARGSDEERSRAAWFRMLHQASGGVLQDAMRLWLASIELIDDQQERVTMGPVPRPPIEMLEELDEAAMVLLLEIRRQGWTDEFQVARLFRIPSAEAKNQLAQLRHLGLLVSHGKACKLAPHLREPVERVLARRGWT